MKKTLRSTAMLVFLIIGLLLLPGCSIIQMGLDAVQSTETKTFNSRLKEISAEFKTRYEKKYGEEFEELGFQEVYRDGYVFGFKSLDTAIDFTTAYYGDYLLNHFPEEMKGEFEDTYWMARISYAISQYLKPSRQKFLTGNSDYLRIQTFFNNQETEEDMNGFYDWVAAWNNDIRNLYRMDYLTKEMETAPNITIDGVYFKDVTKENAEELYQEMFNFVMVLKEAGVEDLDIHISVYDEKYLTDKRIDLENFDENVLYSASKGKRIGFNFREVLLSDIKSFDDFKKAIIVVSQSRNNSEKWLGGKDGN